MKILYIITGLGVGGAEVLLVDTCRELIKERHNVSVVYLTPLTKKKDELQKMGANVIFVDKTKGLIGSVLKIRKIIRQGLGGQAYDIVHTHLPSADTIGRIAAVLAGGKAKIFTSIHNMDVWKTSRSLSAICLKMFNRITVNHIKRVRLLAVAECVKEYCIKHEKIKEGKIDVLYNFIAFDNPEKFSDSFDPQSIRSEGKYTFVNVGRLEEQKGQMLLLQAADELVNKRGMKNFTLYILGGGTWEKKLKEYISAHNLEESVKLAGFITNTFDYLKNSDLFLFPSLHEGFGIAAFEAFFCGTPVITSDIDTARELMVDGQDSIFFKSGDYMDLTEKIVLFLNNKIDIKAITERASKRCEEFTLKVHVKKLLEEYYD